MNVANSRALHPLSFPVFWHMYSRFVFQSSDWLPKLAKRRKGNTLYYM